MPAKFVLAFPAVRKPRCNCEGSTMLGRSPGVDVDPYVAISSQAVQGCQPRNFCQPRTSTCSFKSLRLFEAMGSTDGLLVCSGLTCGNLFYSAGIFNGDGGPQCGVCEVYQEHDFLHRKHAGQFKLLASGRSTSRLLHLFRGPLVPHFVGTLESAMQKYLVRLQRANLRLILSGRPYGFRPVFLRLDRKWARPFNTEQDCLDLVLDFLAPSDELRG